ncbi:CRP-like cAMP-binding protein [Rhodoligotrophos appendicifer]|uniref:Crp/Fnr family transcriptional regulator n=1 Tax=Rhodoligotrophos appendicifer TaxID=987056 RepID=UPI001478FC11|nr:Crp/Fnr family transcriptional regulator [Rhodoligotrophos appendicifer]
MASVPHTLRMIPLFNDLDDETVLSIDRRCLWIHYAPLQTIIEQDDGSRDILFVTQGFARVIIYAPSGAVVSFRDIAAGTFIGELAAIDGRPRSASVEAIDTTVAGRMAAEHFHHVLASHPAVSMALIKHMAQAIRGLTERVYEFSTLAVRNRIQAELLRLGRPDPAKPNEYLIDPAPTHGEFASRVSSHREAVTRELNRLERLGILDRRARSLRILDLPRLARLVREAAEE